MTTTTAETMALPLARINETIIAGLEAGEEFPYLAVDGGPAGYAGALILPADALVGNTITEMALRPLHPYMGMRTWWVRAGQVTVTSTESAVTAPTVTLNFDDVPVEHRHVVPAGARWATTTRVIDGVSSGERFLVIPPPPSREAMGPILLAWPGHDRFAMFGNRTGIPAGWRGWWSRGYIDYDEAAPVETGPLVGQRVRVTDDTDQPENNGREATLVEMHGETHGGMRYRVEYDNREPGGTYGWWVSRVEALGAPEPVTPGTEYVAGQLVEVHTYPSAEWHGEAEFVDFNGTHVSVRPLTGPRSGNTGAFVPEHVRPVTRPFVVGDRVVLVSDHVLEPGGRTYTSERPTGVGDFAVIDTVAPGGEADRVAITWEANQRVSHANVCCLRLAAPVAAPEVEAAPVISFDTLVPGHWFSWGGHAQWFRVARVEGDIVIADRTRTQTGEATASDRRYARANISHRFVAYGPDSPDVPDFIQSEFEQMTDPRSFVVPGNWYTWDTADNWYHIGRVEGEEMWWDYRINKQTYRRTDGGGSRNIRAFLNRAGAVVVPPTSDLLPDAARQVTPPPASTVAVGEETVEQLRARLAEVQAAYDEDLQTIAQIMQREADDRDWCSEYEGVSRRINERIHGTFPGERTHTWDVPISGTVVTSFTGTVRVQVPRSATSEQVMEAARERVETEGVASFSPVTSAPGWSDLDAATLNVSRDFHRVD